MIDVDPQFNATQCLFSGDEYVKLLKSGADTVLNIFDTDDRPTASVLQGAATTKPKEYKDVNLQKKHNVWALPGNIDLYRLEMVSGEGREFSLRRFIDEKLLAEQFDYVVIDTPPTPSVWMTSALIASDYFLIPVKPDPLSMIGLISSDPSLSEGEKAIICSSNVWALSLPWWTGLTASFSTPRSKTC